MSLWLHANFEPYKNSRWARRKYFIQRLIFYLNGKTNLPKTGIVLRRRLTRYWNEKSNINVPWWQDNWFHCKLSVCLSSPKKLQFVTICFNLLKINPFGTRWKIENMSYDRYLDVEQMPGSRCMCRQCLLFHQFAGSSCRTLVVSILSSSLTML